MSRRILVVAVGLTGCGSVSTRSPDAGSVAIHVDTAGDDRNDGIAMPVRTLKRAIGLVDGTVNEIDLASGRYDVANGETFPYTVPFDVHIAGPAGGGAILVGPGTAPGLFATTATIDNVELENFTVAITSLGSMQVSNVRIRSSGVAIDAERLARMDIDNLDITGATGACATGIQLRGDGVVNAMGVTTRTLGTAIDIADTGAIVLNGGMITGDATCKTTSVQVATQSVVSLQSMIVDGGQDGITFASHVPPMMVSLTDSTIRNVTNNALVGGDSVQFQMTGGELSHNARAGLESAGGSWTFTNVSIHDNAVMGIYLQGSTAGPGHLTMRGSSVVANGFGIYMLDGVIVDLGTATSSGGNTLGTNDQPGLDMDGPPGGTITAVGNTWQPGVQNADAQGHYGSTSIAGPVSPSAGNNFSLTSGWSLQL